MISLRARIFVLVSVVILVILAVSIFLMIQFSKKGQSPTTPTNNPAGTTPNNPVTNSSPVTNNVVPPVTPNLNPEEMEKNAVKQLAKIFIERYGTYSTDNSSANISDVENLVTPGLWSRLSVNLNNQTFTNQPASVQFAGVTTKVFITEIKNWADTTATISLQTIRNTDNQGTVSVKHQNAEVDLVKQDGGWLVQDFRWF